METTNIDIKLELDKIYDKILEMDENSRYKRASSWSWAYIRKSEIFSGCHPYVSEEALKELRENGYTTHDQLELLIIILMEKIENIYLNENKR